MSSIYKTFISSNLIPLFVMNYLTLNTWLLYLQTNEQIITRNLIVEDRPIWTHLLLINLLLLIVSIVKKLGWTPILCFTNILCFNS